MDKAKELHLKRKKLLADRLPALLSVDPDLERRFLAVRGFSARVRASEYHLTNACNIRCKGCWFFEFGHDQSGSEAKHIDEWRTFVREQRRKRVNCALLIGGEPALFPERVASFVEGMRYVSISTNGLKALPKAEPFDSVTVFISLFGGGPLDDELRAIKPNGRTFTGLFDTALRNYRNDDRATFVYGVTEDAIQYIEPTVRRIQANGNVVTFNFYSKYDTCHPLRLANEERLLSEMLRVREIYPETVLNHPEHIHATVTGRAWCGSFGYDVCPSISQDHPDNAERLLNGNPFLSFFNTYKADLKSLELCCTSGHCGDCRDSQAIYSWLMVSLERSLDSVDTLRTWVEVTETYWSQFIWSPFHRSARKQGSLAATNTRAPTCT